MVKIIKYTSGISSDTLTRCFEKLPDCGRIATLHICFEDGSGTHICRKCFNKRVNAGEWITDCAVVIAT